MCIINIYILKEFIYHLNKYYGRLSEDGGGSKGRGVKIRGGVNIRITNSYTILNVCY